MNQKFSTYGKSESEIMEHVNNIKSLAQFGVVIAFTLVLILGACYYQYFFCNGS